MFDAVAQPLIAERAQPVGVRQRRGVRRQDLVLRRRPVDRHRPARRVVDVGDRRRRRAGHSFRRAVAVGVAHRHRDVGADIGVAQRVAVLVGADVHAVAHATDS